MSESDEEDFLAQCLSLGLPKSTSLPNNVKYPYKENNYEVANSKLQNQGKPDFPIPEDGDLQKSVIPTKIEAEATKSTLSELLITPKESLKSHHSEIQPSSRFPNIR